MDLLRRLDECLLIEVCSYLDWNYNQYVIVNPKKRRKRSQSLSIVVFPFHHYLLQKRNSELGFVSQHSTYDFDENNHTETDSNMILSTSCPF
jgi:hypothetical protein